MTDKLQRTAGEDETEAQATVMVSPGIAGTVRVNNFANGEFMLDCFLNGICVLCFCLGVYIRLVVHESPLIFSAGDSLVFHV